MHEMIKMNIRILVYVYVQKEEISQKITVFFNIRRILWVLGFLLIFSLLLFIAYMTGNMLNLIEQSQKTHIK